VRLARRAAHVDTVRACPRDDRQAARALVAAGRRARVAEHHVAHAPGLHRGRQRRRGDELVALTVGEDEDRSPVAGDQRPGLGRCADGDLVGGPGRVHAQEVRQRRDAGRRHRPGAPRRLGAVPHRGQRRGERQREHRAQERRAREPRATRTATDGESDPRPQARGHRGIQAGQIARAQPRHRAAQRDACDEPQPEREQPAAPDPVESAPAAEGERDGERRQRRGGLEADPFSEVGVAREQAQRPGRGRPSRQRGGVLASPPRERRILDPRRMCRRPERDIGLRGRAATAG
jgi:hypothetical protein